ncbi:hypothetical protein GCK32_012285, partial [Trichostrongylus colubriformis]
SCLLMPQVPGTQDDVTHVIREIVVTTGGHHRKLSIMKANLLIWVKRFGSFQQLGYGSDNEEVDRVPYGTRNSYSDHKRKTVDRSDAKLPNDQVREGIVFEYLNYYEFLRNWLDECNRIILRKNKSAIPKRINETITRKLIFLFLTTTPTERARIILPAGVFERNDLLHCDIVIGGLPPSVFFGSGFGHKPSLARAAAAKDLVDKCLRVGLVSDVLHTSIGTHPFFKKRELPRKEYDLAIDALLDLDKKISSGNWPWDLNTARELEPDTLHRLKEVFDSVVQDIYFPRPREWARNEFAHPPMPSNGIPTSSFAENHERAEFCRRCRIRGHSERYCLDGRGRSRERRLPTPEPSHDFRVINQDERLPFSMIDDRYIVDKDSLHYSQDEIEEKIARQREELLRQEMKLRRSEAVGNWTSNRVELQPLLPQPHSSMPQPLLPLCGDLGLRGPVHPLMNAASASSLLLEQQLRASRDGDLQAKLEAKAQKVEEEKRLRQMEEELERRMQRELEEKKRIMEEEIRKQVQLEERARLQMELAQTQQQTYPSFSALANRFTSSYTQPSFSPGLTSSVMPESSGAIGVAYASAPDFEMEEIKLLIKEIEDKLLELQRDCRAMGSSITTSGRYPTSRAGALMEWCWPHNDVSEVRVTLQWVCFAVFLMVQRKAETKDKHVSLRVFFYVRSGEE